MVANTGFTLWLTGMSCTGKSTLAGYLEARLRQVGRNVEILDEADLIPELWGDEPVETKEDRTVVLRRTAWAAEVLTRNQTAVLVAAVSPYKALRDEARKRIGRFLEVYVDCKTEELIRRDSTGRYKKALSGEIPNFIGITEPYEPPTSPEVTIHSDVDSVEEGALRIFQALLDLGHLTSEDLKIITGKRMKATPRKKARARQPARRAAAKSAPAAKTGSKVRPAARAARVVQARSSAAKKSSAKRKR